MLTSDPAIAVEASGDVGAFYRGDGDVLTWRAFAEQRWHGEERFGDGHQTQTRRLHSGPSAVAGWRGHRFAVFYKADDGRLWWKAHADGRWHNDAPLGGGELTSDPVVVRDGPDDLAVFYRGPHDVLTWRACTRGEWHPEERFDDGHRTRTRRLHSGPAVVAGWRGHRFAVFYKGDDGRLWWKAHVGGGWHNDAPVPGGGVLTSDPAVVSDGAGNLGVFYRTEGDVLVWRAFSDGDWHPEERFDHGHHTRTSRPTSGPGVIMSWRGALFAVFYRADGDRLFLKLYGPDGWQNDAPVAGTIPDPPRSLTVTRHPTIDRDLILDWQPPSRGEWQGYEVWEVSGPFLPRLITTVGRDVLRFTSHHPDLVATRHCFQVHSVYSGERSIGSIRACGETTSRQTLPPSEPPPPPRTMDICAGHPVPAGYIKVNDRNDLAICDPSTDGRRNVWELVRYIDAPRGTQLDVCADAPTPDGWVEVRSYHNPRTCGGSMSGSFNMKEIFRQR